MNTEQTSKNIFMYIETMKITRVINFPLNLILLLIKIKGGPFRLYLAVFD